jgi:hypothetical protein
MLGKPAAIGYTFLWSIAYGIIVSIVLTLIMMLFLPSETSSDIGDVKNSLTIIGLAGLAATIVQIWLVFGTAYNYGLVDCPESVKLLETNANSLYY